MILKRMRCVAALVMCLVAATTLVLCGCTGQQAAQQGKMLKVGVRADVVGFGYYNQDTQDYYGLEIDLARELASRLGYDDVEFATVTPSTRKETLMQGDVDCLVALYSISDSRLENFDFSPAYYTDHMKIMVEKSSLIDKVSELKGLTVGTLSGADTAPELVAQLAEQGFTSGKVLKANDDNTDVTFDSFHLLQYQSYQELSDALEAGDIDAVAMDGSVAKAYTAMNRSFITFDDVTESYGVATLKNSDLSSQVSQAVQDMIDDGTIAALVDKWD